MVALIGCSSVSERRASHVNPDSRICFCFYIAVARICFLNDGNVSIELNHAEGFTKPSGGGWGLQWGSASRSKSEPR